MPTASPLLEQNHVEKHLADWGTWAFLAMTGIILFCLGGIAMHYVDEFVTQEKRAARIQVHSGPWGELQLRNLRLEQPMEYVGFEKLTHDGPFWNFGPITTPALSGMLRSMGLDEKSTESLLKSKVTDPSGSLVLKPDENLVLSMTPQLRAKLYRLLAQNPANRLLGNPYYIPDGNVAKLFDDEAPDVQAAMKKADVVRLMKRLVYTNNGFWYFSDPEIVLKHLPDQKEREEFLQSLTSIPAVNASLRIRPETDIDKPLNYWCLSIPQVHEKDIRPLMEANKRFPEGGVVNILYLLPPLARERLFTSPLPAEMAGTKPPDCHWTALNFFNANPDPRLSDNDYASRYIAENYYQTGMPSIPGDLVLLLNEQNRVIHSSVYLADDIVFTKNGINFAQPWVLMHEKDMVGHFSGVSPVKLAYFRKKEK